MPAPLDFEKIISLYESGLSTYKIANQMNTHQCTVYAILKRHGVKTRTVKEVNTHVTCNEDYFSTYTPTENYWAGFIAADGCIFQPKRGQKRLIIYLAEIDKFHLELFSNDIQSTKRLYRNSSPTGYGGGPTFGVSIGSDKVTSELEKNGIVPRKTFNLKVSNLYASSPDFWRGAIDGDGCMYLSDLQIVVELLGTKELMVQFQEFCKNNGINVLSVHSFKNVYRVRLKGSKAIKLLNILYHSSDVRCLRRKKDKLKDLILSSRSKSKDLELLASKIGGGLQLQVNTEVTDLSVSTVEHSR